MSKIIDRNDTPVTLFPHSYLPESYFKKILPFLGSITIFQPWYMEPLPFALQNDYRDAVKLLNPPSRLKPEEGFKGLLSEYKTWIKHNRDKSRAAFLKAGQEMGSSENTTWEIRAALRGSTDAHSRSARALPGSARAQGASNREEQDPEARHSLKWHLILHLARDMEKEHREADRMLKGLKAEKSPLQDLLDEGDVKNPWTDLSQFESDLQPEAYPLGQVFEAWFGLFDDYLEGSDLLLTVSRHVMDYACEAWDDTEKEGGGELSGHNRQGAIDLGQVNFRDEKTGELRDLIRNLRKGQVKDFSKLKKVDREKSSGGTHHVMVKTFFPFSNQQPLKENKLLKYLSGKAMILVEEESQNE